MPNYPVKCDKCGPADVLAKMSECDSLKCPTCKQPVEQDYAAKVENLSLHGAAKRLHGKASYSLTHGCHPTLVNARREQYGERLGQCWQDDGLVKYEDKGDAVAFRKKTEELIVRGVMPKPAD